MKNLLEKNAHVQHIVVLPKKKKKIIENSQIICESYL